MKINIYTRKNIHNCLWIIIIFLCFIVPSACSSRDEVEPVIEVNLLMQSLEITRTNGSAELEFNVVPDDSKIDFIWEGPNVNIQLYKVSIPNTESSEAYLIPSDYQINQVVPSTNESGQIQKGTYTAKLSMTSKDASGQDKVVLALTIPDRRGKTIKIYSQPIVLTYGIQPNVFQIKVNEIEAEKIDEATYYVRLPYGTPCTTLPCEIISDAEIFVDGMPYSKILDLSNPVQITAVLKNDSIHYSLIATYSELPVVYINTPEPILSKDDWVKKCSIQIANAGDFNGTYYDVQMKGRGNSTWSFPKKPYAIKLDKKSEVLGMPRHKRWCLLANWIDRTNMRNEIALETARRMPGLSWTPKGRFVDLVFNGHFVGNYYLCEQIKVDSNRVDIDELSETDLKGETITGGYLIELDTNYDEVNKFRSKELKLPVNFKEPDEEVLQPEQFEYLENYFNDVEDKLIRHVDFSEIERLLDIDSFIDWWFVYEIAYCYEPNHPKSSYMHKQRGGKLTAGPVWDFDYATFTNSDSWRIRNSIWYSYLFSYTEFTNKVKRRWQDVRPSLTTVPEHIQKIADYIKDSTIYDYSLWPIYFPVNGDEELSYEESIERLKQVYIDRLNWIDKNINSLNEECR